MATIKEKAKEHSLEPRKNAHCGYDEEDLEDSFEAGANYVLGEIENIIKSDRILGHPFPSLEMRYSQIINVIEQLKK